MRDARRLIAAAEFAAAMRALLYAFAAICPDACH